MPITLAAIEDARGLITETALHTPLVRLLVERTALSARAPARARWRVRCRGRQARERSPASYRVGISMR